jgi:hypothetical protein
VIFTIEQPRKSYRCSACGASDVIQRGKSRRRFRTVSIGSTLVYLVFVAADMSPAYMAAVMSHLPEATLVFDRFHVIKLYNDKLSDLRRELYRTAKEGLDKNVTEGKPLVAAEAAGELIYLARAQMIRFYRDIKMCQFKPRTV